MSTAVLSNLDPEKIEQFGAEMEAIYQQTRADLGESDARYIRRLIRFQRSLAMGSRLLMFLSLAFLPTVWNHLAASWWVFAPLFAIGAFGLGIAKILENMEIGHNVMHGQWDWMHDPNIHSSTWEWDNVCPSDQWKHSHNVVHHTWTNVIGMDKDVGYDTLRISEKQPWRPAYLIQPLVNLLLMPLFQWGVASHNMNYEALTHGSAEEKAKQKALLRAFGKKAARQCLKDYLLWPLLAGPLFGYIFLGNLVANVIRNVWANIIIFCGHFSDGVYLFEKEEVENETRAHWYVRQLLGSANIGGGRWFHILSGNLSHQIEHHLFPDLASNRYPQVAPRVRAACERLGLPYNTGSLLRQYSTTSWKIWRLALPGGRVEPQPL